MGSPSPGDVYTEERTTGWFQRLGSSIGGIFIGLLLMAGASVLLFWNEGRTVKTARALDEAAHVLVETSGPTVDPANQGKLVHVVGDLAVNGVLSDKAFGISAGGVKLKRVVEVYQWKQEESTETVKNLGGSTTKRTTYKYTKVWREQLTDSGSFKVPEGHSNPRQVAFQSQNFAANPVKMGTFVLPPLLVEKLTNFEPVPMDASMIQNLAAPLRNKAQVSGDWCYIGNPAEPNIGDMRIKFDVVKPGPVSVVARQVSSTFEPYTAGNGKTVAVITPGVHSAESMIAGEKAENRLIGWLLRGGGLLLMFIGVYLLLNPIVVLLDFIPFLGGLAGVGAGVAAFVTSLTLSLVIAAVAWAAYRPVMAGGLVVGAVLVLVLVRKAGGRPK